MSAEVITPSAALTPKMVALWTRFGGSLMLAVSRCFAVGIQFLLQIVVGALAGPAGIGVLQLFASWSCTLGEVVARGLPVWSMRVVAIETAEGRGDVAKFNLRWAANRLLRGSIMLGALAALVGAVFWGHLQTLLGGDYGGLLIAVILGTPLFALVRLGAEALKGAGVPLQAVTLENVVIPCVLLLVCGFCWFYERPLDGPLILVASCVALAVTLLLIWKRLLNKLSEASTPSVEADTPLRSTSDLNALWVNSVLAILFMQLPFLLLPWYASPDDIGVYAVAYKLLNVVTTMLLLLSAVFGPAFARAASSDDPGELWRLLKRTQQVSSLIFFPLCLIVLLAVDELSGLFNLPSQELQNYLLILAAGQTVNALTGLSGMLLNMCGEAKLEMKALLASIFVALIATPIIGPAYGVVGLAVLFSSVLVIKSLLSYSTAIVYLAKRKMNS
ncbi:MAG: lipopolysaccharide biosynthesis protein [Halioglobus sp.]